MIALDYVIDQLTTSPLDRLRGQQPGNCEVWTSHLRPSADRRLDTQSVEMSDVAEALGDIAGQLAAPDLSEEWRDDPAALLAAVSERLERLARDLDRAAGVVQDVALDLADVLA